MKISLIHPRLIYLPSQPPLGLGYIAANLEKNGHEVQFIEGAFFSDDDLIARSVKEFGAELIGISVMISYFSNSINLSRIIKELIPDVPIVMGGPHPSVVPDNFIKLDTVDYVLVGEGEESLVQMANAMEDDNFDPSKVPGLRYKSGSADTPQAPRIIDLDALPWPARHLMPMALYQHRDYNVSYGMHGSNLNIITTRGCPYRCNFCDHTVFGYKPISRSIKSVVDEVEDTVKKYNIRNFDIMDDTFTMRQDYVMDFCDELMSRSLNVFWCCRLRVTGVTRTMIQKMADAGCVRFSVGIESVDERVLKETNKRISIPEVVQVLKWAKEYGILTIGNFMIGNIGDTRESINKSLKFSIETSEIDLPSWVVLVPLPGTPVFEIGKKNGWIRSYDWDDYRMNIKELPIWRNEALSHEDLKDIYADVAKKVRPKIKYAMNVLHMQRLKYYPELKDS